jgi:hypothetical protein
MPNSGSTVPFCRTCFSLSRRAGELARLWPFVGQPILAAGGLQPAPLTSRRISRALQHDAFETRSRRNACPVCEWPVPCRRRPGKAACRHDCLPHRAADCTLGNSQSPGASSARRDKLKSMSYRRTARWLGTVKKLAHQFVRNRSLWSRLSIGTESFRAVTTGSGYFLTDP